MVIMLKKCFNQFLLTSTCVLLCFIATAQDSVTFDYTGFPQEWVVPSCVTNLTVTCVGAGGGGNNGGAGATVFGNISVVAVKRYIYMLVGKVIILLVDTMVVEILLLQMILMIILMGEVGIRYKNITGY